MESIIYNKYSNERAPEFNIRTEIRVNDGTKVVCKYATGRESVEHVEKMYDTYVAFQEKTKQDGLLLCKCTKENERVIFPYVEGKNVTDILIDAIQEGDYVKIENIIEQYYQKIVQMCEKKVFQPTDEFETIFGSKIPEYDKEVYVCSPANIDLIFDNIILNNGNWYVIDYEWIFSFDVPMEFILYRSLFYLMYTSPHVSKFEKMNLYQKFGITEANIEIYKEMESAFQRYVVGGSHSVKEYYQPGIDVKNLIASRIWEKEELLISVYEDYGDGFSEENKLTFRRKIEEGGRFTFSYEFPEDVMKVRIDPGEMPIILKLDQHLQGLVSANMSYFDGDKMVFLNPDPWMIFTRDEDTKSLFISGGVEYIGEMSINEINKFRQEIVKYNNILNEYQDRLNEYKNKLQEYKLENSRLNDEIYVARNTMDEMINSSSWKVTAGMRKMAEVSKKFKKQNVVFENDSVADTSVISQIPDIGIHLHLFYTDLLEEFVSYFKNIPFEFNLYISCIEGAYVLAVKEYAEKELSNSNQVVVKILENRGRDIAPFYVGFEKEIQQHKYVLHVHSKKSKHIETGGGDWRTYSLDSLVGSVELVEKIIEKFELEDDIGLVYPECHPDIPMIGYTWMANGSQGKQFLENMGIAYEEGLFHYPAGSFFWARVQAIKPIFDRKLKYSDFPEEEGQIDGTLAHVLERAIVFVSKSQGYHAYIVDIKDNVFRRDRSTKPFIGYMKMNADDLKRNLLEYDSISFDVFDTLLTTDFTKEEDLYEIVKRKLGLNDDYIRYRREAQRIVKEHKGDAFSLDEVFYVLLQISPFDENGVRQLKNAELEALKQSVYPRYTMREIYRFLIEKGKRVSIVTDSCYSLDVIESILVKCGYIGYEKVYCAADLGYSKKNEQVWNLLYQDYEPMKHIHVGADVYADWYTLEKRGTKSCWIMSGMESYKLSKYYDDSQQIGSYEESIALGESINREWFNSPLDLVNNEAFN